MIQHSAYQVEVREQFGHINGEVDPFGNTYTHVYPGVHHIDTGGTRRAFDDSFVTRNFVKSSNRIE
jgi:hypothetical protein